MCCRDVVRSRSGALVLGALADLAAVAVMGRERQVGVEVSLAEVKRPVRVFKDLKEEEKKVSQEEVCLMIFESLERETNLTVILNCSSGV